METNPIDVPASARPWSAALMGLLWVAIFVLLIAPVFILSALGGQWLGRILWPGLSPLFHGVAWIAGVLAITWIMRVKVNKAPWAALALPPPQLLRLLLGALVGVAAILVAASIEYEMGWLHIARIDMTTHRGVSKPLWMALALVPSLAVGFTEELSFRGYVFGTLAERMPIWTAGLAMSVVFALAHFTLTGFSVGFVLSVVVISFMFLTLRFATGSLWFPIGLHGAWDWTQTYLVGLGNTATPGTDPALVQVRQTGSSLWVGSGQAIESGCLFMLIELAILALALAFTASRTSTAWARRLDSTPTS